MFNAKIKINDIKIDIKTILKILLNKDLSKWRNFLLISKIAYKNTPTHVDNEVAIGIIMNPIFLKNIKLIEIFKTTINNEI